MYGAVIRRVSLALLCTEYSGLRYVRLCDGSPQVTKDRPLWRSGYKKSCGLPSSQERVRRSLALLDANRVFILILVLTLRHGARHADALRSGPGPCWGRWRISQLVQQRVLQHLRSCSPIRHHGPRQCQSRCRLQLLRRRHRYALCLVGCC